MSEAYSTAPVLVGRRFCGPPNSGNGGYVCGLLGRCIGGGAEVTLHRPPPLEKQMAIVGGTDGGLELRDGEVVVASARAAHPGLREVRRASPSDAEVAWTRWRYAERNQLPTCFVCGPARAPGDGLRIFPGPVDTAAGALVAAAWAPDAGLCEGDGRVGEEFVWAALDCPSGFALFAEGDGSADEPILLGRLAVSVVGRPKADERCVIAAWPTGREGRKRYSESALFGGAGEVLATARATWIVVDRRVQIGQVT